MERESEVVEPGPSKVAEMEKWALAQDQVECPVDHFFAPGVYVRQIRMPASTLVIGHQHKTEHLNVILSGRAIVAMDGVPVEITEGMTFVSYPGVRKVLFIIEEMVWQTIHPVEWITSVPTESKQVRSLIDMLEEDLIEKSQEWLSSNAALIDNDIEQMMGRLQ